MTWLKRNWPWIAVATGLIILLILVSPAGLYWWNYNGFKSLLHDHAGLGEAWAEVGAIVLGVAYAIALPSAGRWIFLGGGRPKAILAAVFVLVTPPLLHALLDTNFIQPTGKPQKYYVWHPGGELTLSDSPGYDPDTGTQKRPITPEVARILAMQRRGIRARQVQVSPMNTEFFDTVTGRPKVWYQRDHAGHLRLFDNEGFSSNDGSLLLPITREIIEELIRQEQTRRDADEKARNEAQRREQLAERARQESIQEHDPREAPFQSNLTETNAAAGIPNYVAAAVADSARPIADTSRDSERRPSETAAFALVKPGHRVLELVPGSAYYTRILSKLVGPTGHVYAFTPADILKVFPNAADASRTVASDRRYPNVSVLTAPASNMSLPRSLDVVWAMQNYHDLHFAKYFPSLNVLTFNKELFVALRPRGIYFVVDHSAARGSGLRDNNLHRIDADLVKGEVTAAGFVFDAESSILRNPNDSRSANVFEPSIRGHTDQFIFRFRRPGVEMGEPSSD